MALFFFFCDPSMLGTNLTAGKLLASEPALICNFLLNDKWTFGDIVMKQQSADSALMRFLRYHAVCLFGITVNVTAVNILVHFGKWDRYEANAAAIVIASVCNFSVNRRFTWKSIG